jgi:signal transduction histidine kinase
MSGSEPSFQLDVRGELWLRLARASWLIAAAVAIGILVLAIPGYLFSPSLSVFDGHLVVESGSPAVLLIRAVNIASLLSAAGSLGLAFFLFRRKGHRPMGLFLAYYLLGHGILFAGPIELLRPYWAAAPWVNSFILLPLFFGPMTMALIALFPDGRFVPSWSRWLIPISLLAVPVSVLGGDNSLPVRVNDGQLFNTLLMVASAAVSAAVLIAAIYVQVYRYRKVSTPEQRLQTKWVLYSIGLWVAVNGVTSAGWAIALQLPAGTPLPIWLPVSSLFWVTSSLLLPAALTISITRYRLFEIDLIINRTLVYVALTIGVVGVYVLVVASLGILFQTQGNPLVALVATGIVAVVFQPLREWLQRGVNRLIFGERDDPISALSRLGRRLEAALAPDEVLPMLVESIAQTLKLPYVAIVLLAAEGDRVMATHGTPSPDTVPFPLTYQGQDIGQLVVASRAPGATFSRPEMRLLQNIGRQAGAAIWAAQLTADLRRSRQQIVTAREEERRRLRRDLHDGIGPAMAGQALKLDAALDLIAAAPDNDGPELREATEILTSLKAQNRESIASIRRIVYGLRPPALDDLGLLPAIKGHVTQLAGGNKSLHVTFDAPEEGLPRLPAAVEVAVYHIVLEGLANVIHHAQARNCQIRLIPSAGPQPGIELEIIDDGVGLPGDLAPGVGLSSMRGRVTELGGRFAVVPRSPSGTRVRADIPLMTEAA